MTTSTQDRVVTARAKAFSNEVIREHKFAVAADGTVRVWDSVGKYYTTCHSMSARTMARIRKLASK